jgi:CheY-like chemotaxis protein
MNGLELYRRMQDRIQSFVFLAGDAFSADMRALFHAPNQAVLAKPFTAADVQRLLEEIEPRLLNAHAGQV